MLHVKPGYRVHPFVVPTSSGLLNRREFVIASFIFYTGDARENQKLTQHDLWWLEMRAFLTPRIPRGCWNLTLFGVNILIWILHEELEVDDFHNSPVVITCPRL
jgi:hypothetical protein